MPTICKFTELRASKAAVFAREVMPLLSGDDCIELDDSGERLVVKVALTYSPIGHHEIDRNKLLNISEALKNVALADSAIH